MTDRNLELRAILLVQQGWKNVRIQNLPYGGQQITATNDKNETLRMPERGSSYIFTERARLV